MAPPKLRRLDPRQAGRLRAAQTKVNAALPGAHNQLEAAEKAERAAAKRMIRRGAPGDVEAWERAATTTERAQRRVRALESAAGRLGQIDAAQRRPGLPYR